MWPSTCMHRHRLNTATHAAKNPSKRSGTPRSPLTSPPGGRKQQPSDRQQQQAAAVTRRQPGPVKKARGASGPKQSQPQVINLQPDDLGCSHFGPCSGCTLQHGLWRPPVVDEAQQFFSSSGFEGFTVQQGPVHGWRCRAKLAVRGTPDAPAIGLFEAGSHSVTPIPDCRAHHPRINAAAQLVQQVAAGLRIPPYQEQQQQRKGNSSSSSSSGGRGYLRYLQLTALPSEAGGRAEDDEHAQVQLVIVWAAPDASHPSFADVQRLAAALWNQGGPPTPSPLARLRARAEAATGNSSSSSSSSSGGGGSTSRVPGSSVVVRRGLTGVRGSAAAATAAGGGSNGSNGSGSDGGSSAPPPPLLQSVWVNFQPHADSNRVVGEGWQCLRGPQTGWQEFGGVQVAVQPDSFVQANYGAMQRCLSAVAAAVPQGSSVLELYAGSGVIGLGLAAAGVARRVVCVEINPLARQPFKQSLAKLAQTNQAAAAKVSHMTASAGDAGALQQLLVQQYPGKAPRAAKDRAAAAAAAAAAADGPPDVLVVDPPRKGLDEPLLQLLTQQPSGSSSGGSSSSSISSSRSGGGGGLLSVKRLVYLSCGFDALQSDAGALLAAGWRVRDAQGFLFFPGTDTIETLAVFERD